MAHRRTLPRLVLTLAAFLALAGAPGCGRHAVGSVADGGADGADARPRPDGAPHPDGGLAAVWGTLLYDDERRENGGPGLSARFTAAFYEVDYTPGIAAPEGYVETRVTHDNVECDIYFTSPDWGGAPPPLPPEPEPVDVGEIRLESAFDAADAFAISWAGARYDLDERPRPDAALPGWVTSEQVEAVVALSGSSRLPAASLRVPLYATPELLEPVTEDVVQPDANGLFRIAWESHPEHSVQVRLDMNMDWDNATFLCRPPAGHPQVLLPQTWLNEYSWGYAELRITGRQREAILGSAAALQLRARRTTYRSVQFEIQW